MAKYRFSVILLPSVMYLIEKRIEHLVNVLRSSVPIDKVLDYCRRLAALNVLRSHLKVVSGDAAEYHGWVFISSLDDTPLRDVIRDHLREIIGEISQACMKLDDDIGEQLQKEQAL